MRKVPQRDGVFLVHVRHERALVVDAERKDAVLIRRLERGLVHARLSGRRDTLERKPVVRVQHREFKLQRILGRHRERDPVVNRPLLQFNLKRLSPS